jgi:hypothetical protein
MSYTSTSELPAGISLSRLREVIELLGYKKVSDGLIIPERVGSYFWYEEHEYRSYVGVELDIYKDNKNNITVSTRSRVGRSYWDLVQQNRTLKMVRELFGGHFVTDAGRNRYWRPDEAPPSPLASGCFIGRWRLHNALGRAHIYLMHRKLEGDIARDGPSPFTFLDDFNPRLLSNNLLIPYIVAVWEEYFRHTFTVLLQYSSQRTNALKKARLTHHNLEQVASGANSIERAIAETFYFQRPSAISEQFKLIDKNIDIAGALRKPYKRRKTSLYDSIEAVIEDRNGFVHSGVMNVKLFDKQLKTVISDFEEATNRAYEHIADHYGFEASHDY